MGRRRGRLPGRQLPAAVDRVERQVPRHRARLLARRAGDPAASSPRGFTGSSDLYEHYGRKPIASINFVTAHDGFTLRDLVSYNEKHNEANGEGNNDGESHNRSWNCGVEGPTDDLEVSDAARAAAAQLPHDAAALAGRADAAARRRAGPHPARQQQRLLPGQRALLGRLGARRPDDERCSTFTTPAGRAAQRPPGLPPPPVLPGRPPTTAARASSATSPGSPRPASTWTDERLAATGYAKSLDGLPQRRRHPASRTRAASRSSTTRSSCFQRASPRGLHHPRRGLRRALGPGARHHDDTAGSVSYFDDAAPLLSGLEFEVADRSAVVLRKPRS